MAMVVARTLDWETSDAPRLWAIPRGVERSGAAGPGSVEWTTKYGSVTMQGWGGDDQRGDQRGQLLGAHLYLEATRWEPPDERPALANLLWIWAGDLGIPGDIVSEERFVRATYYLSHLPKPADETEAVAGAFGVIRNCQVPYGAPDNRSDTYPTWWAR